MSTPDQSTQHPQIQCFVLGPWQTNCYVVTVPNSAICWIIDAGFDPEPMIDAILENGLKPTRLILTHAHIDHIAGVRQIVDTFENIPIAIHTDEAAFLTDPNLNLSIMLEQPITTPEPQDLLNDGDHLELEGTHWHIRHTPGHSPGGITLYNVESNQAIVGDTLFAGSIGRYDFPTSDGPALFKSIKDQLLTMPDETIVYPGHGPQTTIGTERRSNPFLM